MVQYSEDSISVFPKLSSNDDWLQQWQGLALPVLPPTTLDTGGIERFLAKENSGKILKVSHFHLEFSLDENYDEIEHSQPILSEFPDSFRDLSRLLKADSENSNESLWTCLICLLFLSSGNPKSTWLAFKLFPKISLAENLSLPPVRSTPIYIQNLFLCWVH